MAHMHGVHFTLANAIKSTEISKDLWLIRSLVKEPSFYSIFKINASEHKEMDFTDSGERLNSKQLRSNVRYDQSNANTSIRI